MVSLLDQGSSQHEKLQAVRRIVLDRCACLPTLKPNIFFRILEEWQDFDAGALSGDERRLVGVDAHVATIVEIELPKLDKDDATGSGARRMTRCRRISDVSTGRKVAVLVLKDSL
ncbi:hypothetical protein SCE1572_09055 [Sorangium cellulosum So0157-2]|uniref:Uncharacterized protein n=1 Tax=Sorangium cellulosum So0157-2 TaxID=1254432 RepID=S4XVK9_SORCE|nr:hypothetical protein SCE1572_09055 [Sorangium cellulosum So0157-2]